MVRSKIGKSSRLKMQSTLDLIRTPMFLRVMADRYTISKTFAKYAADLKHKYNENATESANEFESAGNTHPSNGS